MAFKVSKEDVWVASMKDQPGQLAKKLSALADAGAQLEFVIARRAAKKKGMSVVFVTPLAGARQLAAAKKARFRKSKSMYSLRVEGADKPGLGAQFAGALGDAGINLRGVSAAVIGRRFVLHIALNSSDDANKAARILRKL